jgi:uncharacterized protein YpuA (DUF1002 family)
MKTLDETIKELEGIKEKWSDKYQELGKYVEECANHANSDTPDEIKNKLDGFSHDLRSLGQDYRDKIKEAIDDIAKNHLNDSFVKDLADGIISDIDNSGGINGSREDRLRELAGLIDMIDKLAR